MTATQTAEPLKESLPQLQEPAETEAGNYFVANYPPFSCWSGDELPAVTRAIESPPRPDTTLGLYAHIPFCRKRCHFCYFKVYTDKNSSEIRDYMDAVLNELAVYAGKPFVDGRKPKFIYFGGGTPSYLSPDQLRYLTDGMKEALPWDEAEEVAFEAEPGTINEKKLEALKELGVTRLSLGLENYDDHILELNGRAHRSKEIFRAYDYARQVGFDQINIDLIAGMVDETDDNWRRCVEKTIELAPECITIYQMEVPYNTTLYKRMREEGKTRAPVAGWPTKRRWVREAFEAFEAAGYTVTSAYTAVKNPEKTKFLYRDELWAGADLLSVGVASFGHISGVHYQNEHDIVPYVQRVQQGELPIARAHQMTDEEALVRAFILPMKLGHVDFAPYQRHFGVDVAQRFAEPLKTLVDGGFAKLQGGGLTFTREAMLQVDRLLHEFFLPQHRDVRYA